MKIIMIVSLLWMNGTEILWADSHPPSDADVLMAVLSTAIQKILDPHNPLSGETVALTFSSPFTPSQRTLGAIEGCHQRLWKCDY